MRVLKSKFVRVFLSVVLILSFCFSSAFGASVDYTFAFPEPPSSETQGYLVLETTNGAFCYWWNTNLYGLASGDNDNNDAVVMDINISRNSVSFTMTPLGSYAYYGFNISYAYEKKGNAVTILRQGDSAGTYTVTDSFSSEIIGATWYGNVRNVSRYTSLEPAYVTFGGDGSIIAGLNSLLGSLGNIDSRLSLTNSWLGSIYTLFKTYPDDINSIISTLRNIDTDTSTIISILNQWASTSLDESTSPLPNQGLTDFESSQGSLRNDSDVSSSLDNVFNDVDFGGFSNGFTAVWGLVDGVLNSHPIFFTLVILVLSLGLLNLIFNRR